MAKKRDTAPQEPLPEEKAPAGGGQNFNHLENDVRRVAFGLAVCLGILGLLYAAGF